MRLRLSGLPSALLFGLAAVLPVGDLARADPAPQNWTGVYLGISSGVGWNPGPGDHHCVDNNGVPSGPACQLLPADVDAVGEGIGALLGVHGGISVDLNGRFVVGAEVDFGMAHIQGQSSVGGPFISAGGGTTNPTGEYSSNYTINSLSTVRLRGGILPRPDVLVYLTGGLAIADIDASSAFVANNVGRTYLDSASEVTLGFTVGAGLEYAIGDGWKLRAEGLYYDVGAVQTLGVPPGIAPPVYNHNVTFDVRGAVLRMGLSFDIN